MYIQGVRKKIGFLSKNFENATPISPALGTGVTVHVAIFRRGMDCEKGEFFPNTLYTWLMTVEISKMIEKVLLDLLRCLLKPPT